MRELLNDIIDVWRDASYYTNRVSVDFTIMYTSTAEEFIELLNTWHVPFEIEHVDPIRVHIRTLNYWDIMRNKDLFSESRISDEIMENYYA